MAIAEPPLPNRPPRNPTTGADDGHGEHRLDAHRAIRRDGRGTCRPLDTWTVRKVQQIVLMNSHRLALWSCGRSSTSSGWSSTAASPGLRPPCTSPSPRCPRASRGSRPSSGSQLFHRVGRRAVVSAAGEAFLEPGPPAPARPGGAHDVGGRGRRARSRPARPRRAPHAGGRTARPARRRVPAPRTRAWWCTSSSPRTATRDHDRGPQRPLRARVWRSSRSTDPGLVSEQLLVQELVVVLPAVLTPRRRGVG